MIIYCYKVGCLGVGGMRVGRFVFCNIMMEPLSIKSEQNAQTQRRKGHPITAVELMNKFSMKSPSNQRICLTERAPSSGRNGHTSSIRHSESISTMLAFKKNKGEALGELKDQGNRKGERVAAKGREQEKGNSNCRQNIVRMINEISKKAKNAGKIDMPVRKILKDKENICLTERSKTPHSKPKSLALKMNIFLQNPPQQPKTSANTSEERFFRKSSDASTLSLKTKHTASVQLQEESDSLFMRPQSSQQLKKGHDSMLTHLQEAKRRLYQQIYALDKKLLDDYHRTQGSEAQKSTKKAILITLRKKQTKNLENDPLPQPQ